MDETEKDVTRWQIKAACMELIAFSFRYPSKELAESLVSGEWANAAVDLGRLAGFKVGGTFLEAFNTYRNEEQENVLHRIRVEATRLFLGIPEPIISPYEGVWRAKDDGVAALLFVNPHTVEVERFMRACGLGQPKGTNEPLDHVATEFELLQYLASLIAGIVEPLETKEIGDFPGGSPVEAYRTFLNEHAQVWVSRFAEAVLENTKEPFFRGAAQFLKEYCVHEFS